MIITYAGGNCFKLSAGATTVAVNPPSSKSSHKVSKFGADVVLISAVHPDWDGEETAAHGGKEAFVIRGPGAYEVGDVVVTGFSSEVSFGKEASEFGNTIYHIEFDGMKILVLGALSSPKLSQEVRSNVDEIDIVFVPVGGPTLNPEEAHDLVVSLEPHLIVPYSVDGADALKAFLKTSGAQDTKPTDKLTIRTKEVGVMNGEVIVLK